MNSRKLTKLAFAFTLAGILFAFQGVNAKLAASNSNSSYHAFIVFKHGTQVAGTLNFLTVGSQYDLGAQTLAPVYEGGQSLLRLELDWMGAGAVFKTDGTTYSTLVLVLKDGTKMVLDADLVLVSDGSRNCHGYEIYDYGPPKEFDCSSHLKSYDLNWRRLLEHERSRSQ